MTTDLNTLDDWWNEGFDDFFDGASLSASSQIVRHMAAVKWIQGWTCAKAYSNAMKGIQNEH
jgi:hypothetical protein